MIDEDRTIQLFGYTSDELKPKSCKNVIAVCEGCGKYRVTTPNAYKILCHQCKLDTPDTKLKMSIASSRPRGPMPQAQKDNISKAQLGTKRGTTPESVKLKISEAKKGKPTKLKGYKRPFEQRKKLSAINQGIEYDDWTGFADHDRHDWRAATHLNESFAGCHRHHLTETTVVHIPAELHNHIPHNLRTGENMAAINAAALQFMA